jgi:hypothetical protein
MQILYSKFGELEILVGMSNIFKDLPKRALLLLTV